MPVGRPLVFHEGGFMPLAEAKIGIMTHALHYGTSIFEGIRGNWNPDDGKLYIFRPADHYRRLLEGCHMLMIKLPYTADDLVRITIELVERNGFQEDIYIRPIAFKGAQKVANLKLHELEDSFALLAIPFGAYIDTQGAIRCCTSPWRRIEDTMIPPRFKIGGLYVNSILAKTDAVLAGFDEAILLTQDGHVSEGSGENLFLVKGGKLITPPVSDNILGGITRDSVVQLARNELGVETVERSIDRSEMYVAEEMFLTGTAAHLTPVGQVDHRLIGDGQVGTITKALSDLYFGVIKGRNAKYKHWCAGVTVPKLIRV
ncbi:MAG: branched-chain amino acid transaminase [Chloroflexi bacterium]|nr:branched-chain amino acid transaminase [Chloroflexota bacterium]